MRTKTGELLMRRKLESAVQPQQLPSPPRHPLPQPASPFLALSSVNTRPKQTHISHVNDFTYVSQTNRKAPREEQSSEALRQMELQNLRLIESNMRVVEWAQNLVSSLRQSILRVIDTIEDFRYLEAVNKLHQTLAEMTDYQDSASLPLSLPPRTAPSPTQHTTHRAIHPIICPQTYSMAFQPESQSDSDEQQQRPFPQAHTRQQHFPRNTQSHCLERDRESQREEMSREQQMWEMLVVQGTVLQQYIHLMEQDTN